MKSHIEKCHKKVYWEQCVSQLERRISNQKEHLLEHIFQVRETEIHEKYSCNSSCKSSYCIFHQKHDWVMSFSDQFIQEFNNIRVNKENRCELCGNFSEGLGVKKEHTQTFHDVQKCKQSLAEFDQHLQNTHGNPENPQSEISDVNILESPDLMTIESSPNLKSDKACDESFQDSPKHLCNVCLLSFGWEHELKQHMVKHVQNARPPTILKKLQSLSVVRNN